MHQVSKALGGDGVIGVERIAGRWEARERQGAEREHEGVLARSGGRGWI